MSARQGLLCAVASMMLIVAPGRSKAVSTIPHHTSRMNGQSKKQWGTEGAGSHCDKRICPLARHQIPRIGSLKTNLRAARGIQLGESKVHVLDVSPCRCWADGVVGVCFGCVSVIWGPAVVVAAGAF